MKDLKPHFDIAHLIAAYLSESLTEEEQAQLSAWRHEAEAHEALFQRLCSEEQMTRYAEQCNWFNPDEGWPFFQQKLKRHRQEERMKRLVRWSAAAAAILILPLLWLTLAPHLHTLSDTKPKLTAHQATLDDALAPGSAKALLTLQDGSQVVLGEASDSLLAQSASTLIKVDSAALTYSADPSEPTSPSENNEAWNQIETPQGGEYRLTLSDGTTVYLNAMSRLRYPVQFDASSRTVELTGEALFEVKRNGTPFVVQTNGMSVEVLGTIFHLSAYPDDAEVETTLVNGSVKVTNPQGESCLLRPSQQASLKQGAQRFEVREVDTTPYTAWTKGKILFKDERLDEMMRSLSRWYGIKVEFKREAAKSLRFGCNLNRYQEITPLISLLEKTGKVHVTQKGERLIIE